MRGVGFIFIAALFAALVSVLASSAEDLQKSASSEEVTVVQLASE